MKLSILPVSLFGEITSGKMSIAEWAQLAQTYGADGYDVSTLFWKNHTATYIDSIHRELKERDVRISPTMVCTYPDFTNPDALERQRQIDYIRRDMAMASKFGFKYMRVTAGMAHPGIDRDAACAHVAKCFADISGAASVYGIEPVFENHAKPGAWPLIDFSFDPEMFIKICRMSRDTAVGVNFDTANAVACGEDPAAMLKEVLPMVKTIHLNDTSTKNALTPTLVGTGLVDFDSVFKVLRDGGFNGWVCIEEGSGHGVKGIKDAIAFAREYVTED